MCQTQVLSDFRVQSDETVSRETFWYDRRSAQTHFSARELVQSRDLAQADVCDRVHAGSWLPSRTNDRRDTPRAALKAACEAKTVGCDKAPHLCFLLYPEKRILSP